MREERTMYLETQPTKANGYYTRDLLTLFGPLENLKVPRVREGDFHPQILPYRKLHRREKTAKEPAYIALGIKPDGRREVLGFWLFGAEGESAHNWEEVLKDLKRRGGQRVQVFITDDLPGLEEAIKKIFPEADWQLCVLHAVRDALNKVRKKDRKALTEDLKKIYRAETYEEAEEALRKLRKR